MFCEVITNTGDRTVTTVPRGNTRSSSCEPLLTCLSTNELPNFISCVFLFKDTLFNIYCWFISTELTVARHSGLNEAYLTHTLIFSVPTLRNPALSPPLARTLARCLGDILNSEITIQKPSNEQNMALKRPGTGYLFIIWGLHREGSVPSPYLSWNMYIGWQTFHCFAHVCKCLWKCHEYWFWSYK